MVGGPPLTRPIAARAAPAVSDSKDATGDEEAALHVAPLRGWRGIRTETTAATTADNAPPITNW
jgi:hypothetical protein